MTIQDLQSPEIDKITAAFVEAKKGFAAAEKDGKGNFGTFTSLGAIKNCTEESLLENGLMYKQGEVFMEGIWMLMTFLSHTSGQWMANYCPLFHDPVQKDPNKAHGASLTYQRRYASYGFLGVGKDDAIDPDYKQKNESTTTVSSQEQEPITSKQLYTIEQKLKADPKLEEDILKKYNVASLGNLYKWEAKDILEKILKPKD